MKKKKAKSKFSVVDYVKAIKKADRDIELEQFVGWQAITRPHRNKKLYNRKNNKKDYLDK